MVPEKCAPLHSLLYRQSSLIDRMNHRVCMTCNSFRVYIGFCLVFILLTIQLDAVQGIKFHKETSSINLCEKCKIVTNSFKEGLKRTSRGKYEGGDAYWEEKKLKNYADSEIRLTEIQEKLCDEVATNKDQCHSFAEEYESELEEWFLVNRKAETKEKKEEGATLFEYMCNEKIKACCLDGHFGKDCTPCWGYPENICNNRGYCAGNGTRQGKGNCVCQPPYSGEFCEKCSKNYFASKTMIKKESEEMSEIPENCIKCDSSCVSSCNFDGPKGCHVCRKGYIWDHDNGCIDIDECAASEPNPCLENTYCKNTQGSYKCYQCHKSCNGCTSSGPNSCLKCSENHYSFNGKCIEIGQHWFQNWTKYATYLGLCISVLMISRTNIWVAGLLGLFSSIYVALMEYEIK